jgi:hypothetical protein
MYISKATVQPMKRLFIIRLFIRLLLILSHSQYSP